MRKVLLAAALFLAGLSDIQAQSVLQSGSVIPNHATIWNSNGVVQDGGTASDSPLSTLGVTNATTAGFCISSGRSSAAGRQQLCFGAPLNGPAQITLQNYGTATAQNLQFVINGTVVTIPTGGAGFVQYSGTLISGHMPCFSGTSGIVIDCGVGAGAGTLNGVAYYSAAGLIGSTAAGTNGQLLVGQTASAPLWRTVSGDATLSAAGAVAITGINGVTFPANPSIGTVPYVSSSNTITYGTAPVTGGGTGAATLTAHGVLLGQGTNAVTSVVNSNIGLCLLSQGLSADPVFAACGSGSGSAGGSDTQIQFNNLTNLAGSANLTWVSPKLTIGVNGTTSGQLALANSTGGGASVTLQNVSATSAYNFNLPATAGTTGQPLLSGGGAGTGMSFGTLGIVGGGTNCSSASGTCLDNITGFSSTGYMNRTGAGTYTFTPTFGVAQGGTGLASGTSGGILGFTGTTTIASSVLLTQYGVVYGGGAGATPVATAAGTTGQFLSAVTSGAPVWSTATIPATAGSAGTILRSDGTNWVASTATYPATTTVSQLLYSSSGNVIAGLATANGGILNTGATGVPVITATPVLGLAGTTVGTLGFQNATTGTITLSPVAGALGSVTLTLPAATDTVAVLAAAQAFTNKTYNGNTFTAGTGVLTIAAAKTLTVSNSITLAGTDATTMTFPSTNGTIAALNIADQTLSGGANVTSSSQGTKSSGTYTVDCGVSPLQYITNGGAFTLAAPANDGSCIVRSVNNGSAGTITFSGFTVGTNTGDSLTTTNTNAFAIQIWRINGVSRYLISAYQ